MVATPFRTTARRIAITFRTTARRIAAAGICKKLTTTTTSLLLHLPIMMVERECFEPLAIVAVVQL